MAVYPDTSANSTVTWQRSSLSNEERNGAGAVGSGAGPAAGPGAATVSSDAPQFMQKRASAGVASPQLGHARGSAVPQAMQNRAVAGFSVAQLGQAVPAIAIHHSGRPSASPASAAARRSSSRRPAPRSRPPP